MPRILLVEDDPEVRLIVEHLLFDAGHNVDVDETLGGGIDHLEGRAYDLLIADGRLRDGTGMALADLAREKGIPALIITGYAFVLQDAGVDLSRYDVLLKPVSPDELLTMVAKTLDAAN